MYMIDHFPGFGIFTFMAPHCKIYLFQSVIFENVETKVNKWNSGVFVMFLLEFKIVPTFYFRNASGALSYTYLIFLY